MTSSPLTACHCWLAPPGYALAKYEFRGRQLVFSIILGGVLVPGTALALPLYLVSDAGADNVRRFVASGLRVDELVPLPEGLAVRLEGPGTAAAGPVGRLWQDSINLRGATPVLSFAEGHLAGEAAVTSHEHGRGEALYLGTLPDRATLSRLVERACRHAGVELRTDLPRGVEAVRRGEYLFLISHLDRPVELELGAMRLDLLTPDRGGAGCSARAARCPSARRRRRSRRRSRSVGGAGGLGDIEVDRDRRPASQRPPALRSPGLDGDELDVDLGGLRERAQVARIGGENIVAVRGQAHHCGVDRIRLAAAGQQHARPAPHLIIDRRDMNSGQQPGEFRLPPAATAPDLGDYSPAGDRRPPGQALPLHQGHRIPVTTLHRHKRPRIQD